MPQMDIAPSDIDDGKAYLTVGWDADDQTFLFLYARENGKRKHRGYTTVLLKKRDIHELKRFLANHFGSS